MRTSRIILLIVIGIVASIVLSAVVRSLSKIEPKQQEQPKENEWEEMLSRFEAQIENRTNMIDALKRLKSADDELESELQTRVKELSQNGATTATSDATRV